MSYIDLSKPLNSSLPRQQVSLKTKLKDTDKFGVSEWEKDCLDALEGLGRFQYYGNLALRENYQIVSKEFNLQHYMDSNNYYDITSAISQEFAVPYHLKHYDIIGKGVQMLKGEYAKRPDIFTVKAEDADSTNAKVRVKTDLLHSYFQNQIHQEITQKLLQQGIDPDRTQFKDEQEMEQYKQEIQQKYQEMTPPAIEKYMRYDYRTTGESWGNAVLLNDRVRFNFRELEQIEFSDMLIADRCFSHMLLTPIGYTTESWNPLNVFFDQSPEVKNAEDGDFGGRVFYMTKAQVVDRFGWRMSQEQIQLLYPQDNGDTKTGSVYGEFFNATMYPFPAYRDYSNIVTSLGADPFNNTPVGYLPTLNNADLNTGFPNYQFASGDLVQVTEAYWRSQRKIGQLNLLNPDTGKPEIVIVDESFDPKLFGVEEIKDLSFADSDNQPVNTIIWTWVTHIWQGCKINANFAQSVEDRDRNAIYFDVKPCRFQFKGDYTPFQPKLPICGGVFNNRNGKSNSFVDLLKPYQIAHNAFMNLAYGLGQRNNGKFFLLDTRILSNMKDWGGEEAAEKAMTIARELGFVPIDTSPSNIGGAGVQFNQMTVHDMDESEKIERMIKLAIVFEDQGYKQVGITPQRQGQIQASETATGVNQATQGSYAITEPYFENFYNYKRRKLKMLLDLAQYTASKEKDIVLSYITSDMGDAFIKTTGTDIMLTDLGVNINNAQETIADLTMAKELALKNNTSKLPMSKLLQMIALKSVSDITKALEEGEAEQQKQLEAQQQHEQEMQQEQIKAKSNEEDKKMAFEATQNQLDRENELEKAAISASGFSDPVKTGEIDPLDEARLGIEQSRHEFEKSIATQEIIQKQIESINKNKIEKDKIKLSEKDIQIKKKLADEKVKSEKVKLESVKEQNKSQEKMQDKEIKMKQQESKVKIAIAKISAKKKNNPKK